MIKTNKHFIAAGAIALSLFGYMTEANAGTCPTVGAATGCDAIITIGSAGSSVSFTGQGPYDRADDTIVGIVNNTNKAISSISLTSSLPIFGFEGDGIDTYGITGNNKDTTGYGGPNAYFTNITNGYSSGTVNFITPIAQNGTAFFSLEEALSANSTFTVPTVNGNPVPVAPGVPEPSTLALSLLAFAFLAANRISKMGRK